MIKTNYILGKNKLNSFELYSMQYLNNVVNTPVFYANSVLKYTKVKISIFSLYRHGISTIL